MDRMAGALVLCCALAVGAGLWTIGGPFQARIERRDSQRLDDIRLIARHLDCLHAHDLQAGAQDPRCPEPERMADPFTGHPYQVDDTIPGLFRVCAGFERNDPARHPSWITDFDPDTGCVTRGETPPTPVPDATRD